MTKKCRRCNESKPLDEFSPSQANTDGHINTCKPCRVIEIREYYQSPKGRIGYIYHGQIRSSQDRKHPNPDYSKKDLLDWALKNSLIILVNLWRNAGFDKNLAPSVDRLDPTMPYSLNNIRLVPWKDNNDKAYEDRKACRHITRQNRRVRQLRLDGAFLAEYGSISNASRTTGITRVNINDVCRGKAHCKTAGGFLWEYIN